LSFSHFAAVASLPTEEADPLLDWCVTEKKAGRRPSVIELREKVREVWAELEREGRAQLEREGRAGRPAIHAVPVRSPVALVPDMPPPFDPTISGLAEGQASLPPPTPDYTLPEAHLRKSGCG
jgi:hypothetical protein